MISKLEFQ